MINFKIPVFYQGSDLLHNNVTECLQDRGMSEQGIICPVTGKCINKMIGCKGGFDNKFIENFITTFSNFFIFILKKLDSNQRHHIYNVRNFSNYDRVGLGTRRESFAQECKDLNFFNMENIFSGDHGLLKLFFTMVGSLSLDIKLDLYKKFIEDVNHILKYEWLVLACSKEQNYTCGRAIKGVSERESENYKIYIFETISKTDDDENLTWLFDKINSR